MKYKPTTECPICHQIIDTSKGGSLARHIRWQHKDTKVKTEKKVCQLYHLNPTADDIADALLRKVIKWATEKETYTDMLQNSKDLRNKCTRLEQENKSIKEERDRLLKIHNEQIIRNQHTSVDEIKKIAGIS